MKILSVETSCDETAISLIEAKGGLKNPRFKVLADLTVSQIKIHQKYGGVFPNLAKREHAKNLIPVLRKVLEESNFLDSRKIHDSKLKAKSYQLKAILDREPELLKQFLKFIPTIKKPPVERIAVTHGPGLEPALWVGINLAKALSLVWDVPIIPVNHMEGHIASVLLTDAADSRRKNSKSKTLDPIPQTLNPNKDFPAMALLISGGHTELVLIKKWGDYKVVGKTRDDAAGECFDKVARMLGLPYPGGPHISALAEISRINADKKTDKRRYLISENQLANQRESALLFPRPMINSNDLDFSFSGLKTAVLYYLKKETGYDNKLFRDVPRSFRVNPRLQSLIAKELEEAIADVLIAKTEKAIEQYDAKSLIIAGGVSANKFLRQSFTDKFGDKLKIFIPSAYLSTDNALMIAAAAYIRYLSKKKIHKTIRAEGNLSL